MSNRFFALVLVVVCFISTSTSFAINRSACSGLLNDGWYTKYKYQGVDYPVTKASKELGSPKGSTKLFSESTTASLDPGYATNVSQSSTQTTSFWGPCNPIALKELRENREKYVAQNKDEVLKEIAIGRGEHLEVLAAFSLCDAVAVPEFVSKLQQQTRVLVGTPDGSFGNLIDATVTNSPLLAKSCYDYGS